MKKRKYRAKNVKNFVICRDGVTGHRGRHVTCRRRIVRLPRRWSMSSGRIASISAVTGDFVGGIPDMADTAFGLGLTRSRPK